MNTDDYDDDNMGELVDELQDVDEYGPDANDNEPVFPTVTEAELSWVRMVRAMVTPGYRRLN